MALPRDLGFLVKRWNRKSRPSGSISFGFGNRDRLLAPYLLRLWRLQAQLNQFYSMLRTTRNCACPLAASKRPCAFAFSATLRRGNYLVRKGGLEPPCPCGRRPPASVVHRIAAQRKSVMDLGRGLARVPFRWHLPFAGRGGMPLTLVSPLAFNHIRGEWPWLVECFLAECRGEGRSFGKLHDQNRDTPDREPSDFQDCREIVRCECESARRLLEGGAPEFAGFGRGGRPERRKFDR